MPELKRVQVKDLGSLWFNVPDVRPVFSGQDVRRLCREHPKLKRDMAHKCLLISSCYVPSVNEIGVDTRAVLVSIAIETPIVVDFIFREVFP